MTNIWWIYWIYDEYMMDIWWIYDEYMMNIWWIFDEYMMNIWWIYDDNLATDCDMGDPSINEPVGF